MPLLKPPRNGRCSCTVGYSCFDIWGGRQRCPRFQDGLNIPWCLMCSFRCFVLSAPKVFVEKQQTVGQTFFASGVSAFSHKRLRTSLVPFCVQRLPSEAGKAWVLESEAWGSHLGLCFHIWVTAAWAFHLSVPTSKMAVGPSVSSTWEGFVGIKWDYAWENAFIKSNSYMDKGHIFKNLNLRI